MGTRADALRRERQRATTTFGAEKKNAANGIKTTLSTERLDASSFPTKSHRRDAARVFVRARARAGPSVYASTTAMASISTSAPRGKPFASIVARAGEFSGNRFP